MHAQQTLMQLALTHEEGNLVDYNVKKEKICRIWGYAVYVMVKDA